MEMILLEELHQHVARAIRVTRADADCPKQHSVLRVSMHESADPLPEEQQCTVISLILWADERSAELKRRRQTVQQRLVIAKQGSRIQPVHACCLHDQIGASDSVCPDDLTRLVIPHEQMQVPAVERVDVPSLPGSLA